MCLERLEAGASGWFGIQERERFCVAAVELEAAYRFEERGVLCRGVGAGLIGHIVSRVLLAVYVMCSSGDVRFTAKREQR
jgi:hypothetical protein